MGEGQRDQGEGAGSISLGGIWPDQVTGEMPQSQRPGEPTVVPLRPSRIRPSRQAGRTPGGRERAPRGPSPHTLAQVSNSGVSKGAVRGEGQA